MVRLRDDGRQVAAKGPRFAPGCYNLHGKADFILSAELVTGYSVTAGRLWITLPSVPLSSGLLRTWMECDLQQPRT